MKITYTNTPANKQKRNYPSFKMICAMTCVIALMVAVKVIYSPDESMEDVAAMANATVTEETKETEKSKESTEAMQTSVLYLSSSAYEKKNEQQTFAPLKGEISSGYSSRTDPFGSGSTEFHRGVDIVPSETKNIIAYADGVVAMADYDPSYGNFIKLAHNNGIETIYAHCSSLKVKEGEKVSAGQLIAITGNTGNSTGEHLHFEVRVEGEAVDPMEYLR